jgi:prepilin-type N-terminal cleavage/methylation domain-containing protein
MKTFRSEKGFSLIEVMIAFVVLLIGMLGIMGMQYYAVSGNAASRELRVATALGQDVVESLKSTPYNVLLLDPDRSDTPVSSPATTGGITYNRRWWVVQNCIAITFSGTDDDTCGAAPQAQCTANGVPDASVAAPVVAVRARACWTDKNDNPHNVTLDSIRWDENAVGFFN